MKQYPRMHRIRLAALALLVTACTNHDFDDLPQLPAGDAVSFRTETQDNFSTRAAGHTTNGAYAIRSIGVYASYSTDVWDDSKAPGSFFNNLSVSRSSDADPWTYTDEQLWPGSGYLSFFAYAPHQDNAAYGTNKPTLTVGTGTPSLTYTIASPQNEQVDLLVATPVLNQTKRDYVTLFMRHALTKIAFSARVVNAPAANTQIRVTRIELSGLYGKGTMVMSGLNRQWNTSGDSNDHSYTVANTPDGGLRNLPLTDIYQPLTPTEGHLFLMPQTLAEGPKDTGATATITYETQVGNNTPEEKTFDLELSRAISKFNPGDAYNLMLTINNGVTFIAVPTPWDKTDVEADVKNRILNVTRIEANVYPGVATRIFFWSNQPKDSVFVLANGNEDDGTKQPKGASYIVNDAFQDLSLVNAKHLHYGGFNGTSTITGEGYIDVWMKDKASSPYAPVLNNGDKRHIWLNASGLNRNILLNAIVGGNITRLPYVGTFHRHNEIGERIVTWSCNGDWTAEIEQNMGDYDQILIDSLPSPFMITGQLYGDPDKEVGDPEAAKLDQTATTVSGTGRVYFRVGWQSRLGSSSTTPRYGRIKVSGPGVASINGKPVDEVHLYIRQGEADDYLMEWSSDRGSVMKWTPYNLTTEGLTVGGSVQVTTNRGNARFVKYPTQAGAFYKWVNNVQTELPMAYAPIGKITFNQVTYKGFWYPVMSMQESCPAGYRRPNRGSIKESVKSEIEVEAEVLHSLFSNLNYQDLGDGTGNSLWGYYADGFFDRRKIEDAQSGVIPGTQCAVDASLATVGYIGRLFYRPETVTRSSGDVRIPCNSLFFPAAGYRSDQKQNDDGLQGYYWSSSAWTYTKTNGVSENLGWRLKVDVSSATTTTSDLHAMSVRCVRDINFSTTLPPYNETGVPTTLSFDANAGATPLEGLFVAKWNAAMARDFRLYTELDDAGNSTVKKITAKVTFRGTTATGNHTVPTDVFASALGKVGSSVTYNFNDMWLTWASGTIFTFYVLEGWKAQSYLGTSTSASSTVDGIETPTPIVLNGKGKVVFSRTSPPVAP